MRHYPWIIRGKSRTAVQPGPPETDPGLRALFPTHRAGTDTDIAVSGLDIGAQVGLRRNLEFTAGGRAHRLSTGSYTKA
jgi:hypothetical protein